MIPKEFIEVTSVVDGRKAAIRAACIDAVVDNAGDDDVPEQRIVVYGSECIGVAEEYDDIVDMIYKAEL